MIKLNYNRFKKSSDSNQTVVYALGGGKGGIGKSFITSNLALYLARSGLKTLIIDLDFGGANAHTYLRVPGHGPSAKDYLFGEVSHLGEVVVPTQFKNLSIIRGASDWDEVLTLDTRNLNQMFSAARQLGFDRIVYDLGAGTGIETVEAFLNADVQLAVSTPEPISIENTYNFLKRVFYRSLQSAAEQHEFKDSINSILSNKADLGINTPADLLRYITTKFPNTGNQIVQKILAHKPQIIINQCRSPRDQKIGKSLSHVSRQYFGQEVDFLGYLDFDNRVWQSIRAMKPLFLESPDSETLREFRTLFSKIENKVNVGYIDIAA
ncbi:MAG: MinD/ParA family ATP-binding protein [Bdellovibrionales bacterium]